MNHSLAPPCTQRLPRAECEQDPRKDLAHPLRIDLLRQDSPRNAAQKYSRDQQQSGFPRDESLLRIGHQRQHSGREYQRDQGRSLCAMLAEGEQQPEERHQKDATADPEHARRHSANARDREDAGASAKTLSLGRGLLLYPAGGTALKLRLLPEQKSRQHEEATERSLQIPGWHGEGDQAPCISAE